MKIMTIYFENPTQHDTMVGNVHNKVEFREYLIDTSYIENENLICKIAYLDSCPTNVVNSIKRLANKIANKKVKIQIRKPSIW